MNKIYKVIWSKARNSYVVTSELAKSHTKSPNTNVFSSSFVAGVLACILASGVVLPVYAEGNTGRHHGLFCHFLHYHCQSADFGGCASYSVRF